MPLVTTTATGSRPTFARPRARKPALRSSTRTCSRRSPRASASASARARAALRLPGREHDLGDAVGHELVDEHLGHGGGRVHDGAPQDVEARASRSSHHCAPVVVEPRLAPRRVATGRGWWRTTDSLPSRGRAVSRGEVLGEQATGAEAAGVGRLGQRGGEGEAGGEPHGGVERAAHRDRQAHGVGDRQGPAYAAERHGLEHEDVGRGADPLGALRRRARGGEAHALVDGEAHARPRARSEAISSSVAHGCSAYSRPPAMSSSTARRSTASSTVQAAVDVDADAAARRAPQSSSAARTAATRATSSSKVWPRSATLTFTTVQPSIATASVTSAGDGRRGRARARSR